jgi:peptidyl-prolyl cis-trans isomerase C
MEGNPPSETELQIAYEQNIERLSGVQYKARHILLDSEDGAAAVIEELGDGADFQELAVARSTGPSGPNGGDLGWFSAETMVPPFAQAVSSMEAGTFSETPVQTRFGWHVILLEDTVDQEPPGLDAVRADITSLVEQRKIEEFLGSLRDTAVVVVEEQSTVP